VVGFSTQPTQDFSPSSIYAFFFSPEVRRCRLVGDMIWIQLVSGRDIQIALHQVDRIGREDGLFFSRLTLTWSAGTIVLHGLASVRATGLQSVHRRARCADWIRRGGTLYASALAIWESLLGVDRYVADSEFRRWLDEHSELVPLAREFDATFMDGLDAATKKTVVTVNAVLTDGRRLLDQRNERFVLEELDRQRALFDSIERFPLTEQQRVAVVHDEDNSLVIAGAGTGKTSTVISKVTYLLERGLACPEGILLLAFTRKAAEEMSERLRRKQGIFVTVRTFHALGLEIIAEAKGSKPSLCREAQDDEAKRRTLDIVVQKLVDGDANFRRRYVEYRCLHAIPYRSAWDFKSRGEYIRHLKDSSLRTLRGERVNSQEEVLIANWLTLNGIAYEYERAYEVDTATKGRRQYQPDFYLPDGKIYIEHFGLDRNGVPPPFLDRSEYLDGVRWKREVHHQCGTTLVETFSWEAREGVLFERLTEKLAAVGVVPSPVTYSDVLSLLEDPERRDPLVGVMATFLALFKGGGHSIASLRSRVQKGSAEARSLQFLELFEPVYLGYQERLMAAAEIDFEDMISAATAHVRSGRYVSEFRHIIVDEFQDISSGRAELLRALRDQVKGSKLFSVGDDWQSIYRFAGADVSLMTTFAATFGYTRTTALDRTFRFDQRLSEFTQRFVLKNPAQLPKRLTSPRRATLAPVEICFRREKLDVLPEILSRVSREATSRLTVLVLNRYNFSAPGKEYCANLRAAHPALEVVFMTAHSSKGLEADVVIVDNIRGGRYGFPSQIEDDPVLSLVMSRPDKFPNGEERRLFYVAMTRARQKVYLVSDEERESSFMLEVLTEEGYDKIIRGDRGTGTTVCPGCLEGRLTRREGPNGVFFGCYNYPFCNYKEEACPECRKGMLAREGRKRPKCGTCGFLGHVCPSCNRGLLVARTGPYGRFFGCTMFTSPEGRCKHTQKFLKQRDENGGRA